MRITVTTKSGSIYSFIERNGETHITRNYIEEGILAEPVSIVPGERLEVKFFQLSFYNYSKSSEMSTYRSTPVVKVEIA